MTDLLWMRTFVQLALLAAAAAIVWAAWKEQP
jgi:hypothetical protein